METKFAVLLDELCNLMNRIPVQKLKSTLLMLPVFTESKLRTEQPMSPFEAHEAELKSATTVEEVFIAIRRHCIFIKFDVIEFLVDRLGDDVEKAHLTNYQECFKDYAKRRAIDCPLKCRVSDSGAVNMVIKLDCILDKFSLDALQEFQYKVCEILEITLYVLSLCCVRKGCIQITYQIPVFVARAVFPLSPKQQLEFQHHSVIQLTCGGYCFKPKVRIITT